MNLLYKYKILLYYLAMALLGYFLWFLGNLFYMDIIINLMMPFSISCVIFSIILFVTIYKQNQDQIYLCARSENSQKNDTQKLIIQGSKKTFYCLTLYLIVIATFITLAIFESLQYLEFKNQKNLQYLESKNRIEISNTIHNPSNKMLNWNIHEGYEYLYANEKKVKLSRQKNFLLVMTKKSLLLQDIDLIDLNLMVLKLRGSKDTLSQYLYKNLSTDTIRLIEDYDNPQPHIKRLKPALIYDLNKILQDTKSFQDFSMIKQSFISNKSDALIHSKRLLLEKNYPDAIANPDVIVQNIGKTYNSEVEFYSDFVYEHNLILLKISKNTDFDKLLESLSGSAWVKTIFPVYKVDNLPYLYLFTGNFRMIGNIPEKHLDITVLIYEGSIKDLSMWLSTPTNQNIPLLQFIHQIRNSNPDITIEPEYLIY